MDISDNPLPLLWQAQAENQMNSLTPTIDPISGPSGCLVDTEQLVPIQRIALTLHLALQRLTSINLIQSMSVRSFAHLLIVKKRICQTSFVSERILVGSFQLPFFLLPSHSLCCLELTSPDSCCI